MTDLNIELLDALVSGNILREAKDKYISRRHINIWSTEQSPATFLTNDIFGKNSVTAKLNEWLMSQPENSVTPEEYFFKALDLGDNDIDLALIAGWNILIQGRTRRDRNHLQHIQKFIDVRGDRKDLFLYQGTPTLPFKHWTSKADNYSALYHFWGAFLYSYAHSSSKPWLRPALWVWYAICFAGEQGYFTPLFYLRSRNIASLKDWPRRASFDYNGYRAGDRLAKNLNNSCMQNLGRLATQGKT